MTISADQEALIRRLYHAEKWRMGTIARELGVHHNTVARVLAEGVEPVACAQRPSRIDPFVPFLQATLVRFPRLCASRLHEMVRERGYIAAARTSAIRWRSCAPGRGQRRTCACAPCQASRRKWTGLTSVTSRSAARCGV